MDNLIYFYLGGVVATLFSVSLKAYEDDMLDLSILVLALLWPLYLFITPYAVLVQGNGTDEEGER